MPCTKSVLSSIRVSIWLLIFFARWSTGGNLENLGNISWHSLRETCCAGKFGTWTSSSNPFGQNTQARYRSIEWFNSNRSWSWNWFDDPSCSWHYFYGTDKKILLKRAITFILWTLKPSFKIASLCFQPMIFDLLPTEDGYYKDKDHNVKDDSKSFNEGTRLYH